MKQDVLLLIFFCYFVGAEINFEGETSSSLVFESSPSTALLRLCPNLASDRLIRQGDAMVLVDLGLTVDVFYGIDTVDESVAIHGDLLVAWTDNCSALAGSLATDEKAGFTFTVSDPGNRFWQPSVLQMFSRSDALLRNDFSSLLVVRSDGNNSTQLRFELRIAGTFQSQCRVDLADYPFDEQACDVIFSTVLPDVVSFGEVLLNDFSSKVSGAEVDFSRVTSGNSEWMIKGATTDVQLERWNNATYSFAVFTFRSKRRPEYFIFYWLIPCFILSLLNLGTFLLPVEDTQRPMFSVSVLLALMVLLSQVVEKIPETPKNIFITDYICTDMSYTLIVTLYSAAACRIRIRNSNSSRRSSGGKSRTSRLFGSTMVGPMGMMTEAPMTSSGKASMFNGDSVLMSSDEITTRNTVVAKKKLYCCGRFQLYQIIDFTAFACAAIMWLGLQGWVMSKAIEATLAITA